MKTINVGIQAVVPQRGNPRRVLLGKRLGIFGHGQWALPGGHLEFGESFESAAKRELKEETDIDAEKISVLSPVAVNTPYGTSHYVQIGLQVMKYNGVPRNREPDRCAELRWWDLDDPLPTPLFAPSRPFLELVKERLVSPEQVNVAPRLYIYLHCGDQNKNIDKYIAYDVIGDIPEIYLRFGRRNESRERQTRAYRAGTMGEAISFLKKDISTRLSHRYRVSDIRGNYSLDTVYAIFPPGEIVFQSTGYLEEQVASGVLNINDRDYHRSPLNLKLAQSPDQMALFDDLP